MSLTLREIKEIQKNFDVSHGVGGKSFYVPVGEEDASYLEHMAVCLVGEVGEFCNVLKKVVRGDLSLIDAKPDLSEELIDSFIYLIKIANQFDVDLESEFLAKVKKNEARFKLEDK
jgi:NTP pyrophosphatase (non-canonical NTP hydrolase)